MAARTASPGASLLRSSRMFSLPAPLPTMTRDDSHKYGSNTATAPFPTMQAVTTPQTSRRRGDWGFKRPLPLKATTKTTTPLVRVKHFDTIEHITDYSSSSDLSLTLEKFQELHLPLSQPQLDKDASKQLPTRSVFEDDVDMLPIKGQEEGSRNSRWKFNGPWLAGITNGAFNAYAEKVQNRRGEFREYLKGIIAKENTTTTKAATQDEAGLGEAEPAPFTAADITDDQVTEYLRKLRGQNERGEIHDIVGKFLDLAPIAPKTNLVDQASRMFIGSRTKLEEEQAKKSGTGFGQEVDQTARNKLQNPYASQGPPSTHPSAGLSYLRTNSYMDNHPIYGPQDKHAPVLGRLVKPAYGGGYPQIGVGGFIAQPLVGESGWNPNKQEGKDKNGNVNANLATFDPNVVGGKKQYVQLQNARISSDGRVVLNIWEGDKEHVSIAKEMTGEEKVLGQKLEHAKSLNNTFARRQQAQTPTQSRSIRGRTVTGSLDAYGLGR